MFNFKNALRINKKIIFVKKKNLKNIIFFNLNQLISFSFFIGDNLKNSYYLNNFFYSFSRKNNYFFEKEFTIFFFKRALNFFLYNFYFYNVLFFNDCSFLNIYFISFFKKMKLPFFSNNWVNGFLTNFHFFSKRISFMKENEIERFFDKYSSNLEKIKRNNIFKKKFKNISFKGLYFPEFVVSSCLKNDSFLYESSIMELPIINLCKIKDTGINNIAYPILANTCSLYSLLCFACLIKNIVIYSFFYKNKIFLENFSSLLLKSKNKLEKQNLLKRKKFLLKKNYYLCNKRLRNKKQKKNNNNFFMNFVLEKKEKVILNNKGINTLKLPYNYTISNIKELSLFYPLLDLNQYSFKRSKF